MEDAPRDTLANAETAQQHSQGQHEEEVSGVPGLPVEVQQYLVTLLVDHRGALFAASLTCRLWHLLTLEDVVWRKYAQDKWDMLPPRRQGPHDEDQHQHMTANHNATDWLLVALHRWRPTQSAQPQEQYSGVGEAATTSSTKWRDLVRAAQLDLAGVPPAADEAHRASVYIRHGLKQPLEQYLDAMPDTTIGSADSPFGVSRPKGDHLRNLILEAINHRAPPGVLPLLLAYKPNLCPNVLGSGEYKISKVPLLSAIRARDEAAIELLLDAGADPAFPCDVRPLHYAVYCGLSQRLIKRLLLGAFASVRAKAMQAEDYTKQDLWSGFEMPSPLLEACAKGNLEALEALIHELRDVRTSLNKVRQGNTPLWVAIDRLFKNALPPETTAEPSVQEARNARLWGVTTTLLKHGADPNRCTVLEQSLLSWVIEQPLFLQPPEFKERLVGLLLEHGADVNEQDPKTGDTALHLVARQASQVKLMELLLASEKKPHVNATNVRGRAALYEARLAGSLKMVKLLEAHGADANLGWTPPTMEKFTSERATAPVFSFDLSSSPNNKPATTPSSLGMAGGSSVIATAPSPSITIAPLTFTGFVCAPKRVKPPPKDGEAEKKSTTTKKKTKKNTTQVIINGRIEHLSELSRRDREETQSFLAQTFGFVQPVDHPPSVAGPSAPPQATNAPHE